MIGFAGIAAAIAEFSFAVRRQGVRLQLDRALADRRVGRSERQQRALAREASKRRHDLRRDRIIRALRPDLIVEGDNRD